MSMYIITFVCGATALITKSILGAKQAAKTTARAIRTTSKKVRTDVADNRDYALSIWKTARTEAAIVRQQIMEEYAAKQALQEAHGKDA